MSLSSLIGSYGSAKPDHLSKKQTRLVCECPSKCSSYEQLITELISEANSRATNDNHQYSANQLASSNDEYLQSSSKYLNDSQNSNWFL